MTDVCLHLLAAPEIEEQLLDRLLLNTAGNTFTSARVASHGGQLSGLDPREQVLGRGDAILVHVLLEDGEARALIEELREQLSGAGIRYWITPLLGEGRIG